eukprot:TRINITY_DN3257_c0_g2_i1.p1 TRINITY_DN3257_c0_g2~~TRINITY_DN3257_c0_g2_i1.p1  ORF type:complete len:227 (-),score=70.70 TRINITY_DN3257_c0_g2_i1:283-963(-)
MPKKFGTNTKSEEARERKAEVKAATRSKLEREKEDAKWGETDKQILAKESRRQEDEEKRLAALERKKQNAELAKKEEEQLSQQYRKPVDTKLSRAEIQRKREEAELQAKAEQKKKEKEEHAVEEITENVNRILSQHEQDEIDGKAIHARSVDQAIEKLGSEKVVPADKHPERRLKAAYLEYEARELPILKQENPGLKHSQLKELLWKQWQKSPENPLLQALMQEQQ